MIGGLTHGLNERQLLVTFGLLNPRRTLGQPSRQNILEAVAIFRNPAFDVGALSAWAEVAGVYRLEPSEIATLRAHLAELGIDRVLPEDLGTIQTAADVAALLWTIAQDVGINATKLAEVGGDKVNEGSAGVSDVRSEAVGLGKTRKDDSEE